MEKEYKVIDTKVIPTLANDGTLAIAYIKVMEEVKEVSAAASAFSASFSVASTAANDKGIAVLVQKKGEVTGYKNNTDCLLGNTDKDLINAQIDELVVNMSEANKMKVRTSIVSSYGIIPIENYISHEFTAEEENQLADAAKQVFEDFDKLVAGVVGGASGDKLEHYAFRKHLLIQGEKGGGKTYMVDKMIKDKSYETEFIGGHEALEAIDFLGYYIKTESGSLVWKDGGLTSAFRRAAKGEKVVLFIDEMLRIPKRELNILVAALTPDSDGNFKLRTSRAINISVDADGSGIANEEIIEIPSSALWAIGTTNAGAGYAVDTIDEALADRFRTIIKTVSEKELRTILSGYVKDKGFDKKIVTKLMDFYKQFHTLKKSGELTKVLNVRHLVESVTLSDDETQIKDMLTDLIPTLVTMDVHGMPSESQSGIVEVLIEKSGI